MKLNKKILISATLLISLTVSGATAFADTNVTINNDIVKIFVGAKSENSLLTRASFVNERSALISENALQNPSAMETALVTFDSYLSIDDAEEYITNLDNVVVKQIFLGIPGIDGRTIISSGAGDLSDRISAAYDNMLGEELDEETRNLILSHKNNAQIFAITIETTNSEIATVANSTSVSFVDLFNYPEAEQLAAEKNLPVSYIAVPEKPDNSY